MVEDGRPTTIMIVVTAEQTAALFVSGFAAHLGESGHRVVLVADRFDTFGMSAVPGVELAPIAMRRNPSPMADLRSLFALLRLMLNVRPDVLTYATPKASLLASLAGKLVSVETRIYQLWGLRLETVHGPGRHILALMELATSWLSTRILANSASLRAKFVALSLNAGRVVSVLGMGSSHGVDLHRFNHAAKMPKIDAASSEFLKESKGLTVGFVGRLHKDKGISTLIEAARLCVSDGVRLRLLIVGSDEGAEWEIGDIGEELNVHFTGSTGDPRPYFTAMDVLCLPSLREGFPNVVLEAGAMGVPSVVSNATGAVDSVVHLETGIVTPVRAPEKLAVALTQLATDGELLRRLGKGALKHTRANFQQQTVWNELADYLLGESTVKRQRASRTVTSDTQGTSKDTSADTKS